MANEMQDWSRLSKRGIILRRGDENAWDAGMVECPVVWFDKAREKYGMVYTGYGLKPDADLNNFGYHSVTLPQIGLAWSDDLLNWTKDERAPIFGASGVPGSTDSHGTSGPFLLSPTDSGLSQYALFYFGVTDGGYEGGTKTLNVAFSDDLYRWERPSCNPIITPTGDALANRWRSTAIWHPNVIKVDGLFYCFFNASGEIGDYHEEFIGYATSPDLKSWTVHDEHCPLVGSGPLPGEWNASGRAGDPAVFRIGDTWWMAFYSWDNVNTQDGMMYTTAAEFPIGWRAYSSNPILPIGPAGTFDSLHAGKPFVYRTKDTHYHFYTAVDGDEKREIAVATQPIP